MKKLVPICVTVAVLVLPDAARSDTLYFQNGDRLTGSLSHLSNGNFNFSNSELGTIEVPKKAIESFDTKLDVEVWMLDGSVITGPVTRGSIPVAGIEKINPAETGWTGRVSLGLQIDRGNTVSNGADARITMRRRFGRHRLQLQSGYAGLRGVDDEGNDVTDRRQVWGGVEYDHFVSQRWFSFAHSNAERNGLADLSLRLITGGGFGYQIIDSPTLAASVRTGLNWVRERYDDDSHASDYPGGKLGWELEGHLSRSLKFSHTGEWVPSLRDFGDNQLVRAQLSLRQSLWGNWFGEAQVRWQLNTEPAPDTERQDASYSLSLGWGF